MITAKELSERSGATFRQINWWVDIGLIKCEERHQASSGVPRKFNESVVGPVSVLVKVSKALGYRRKDKKTLFERIVEVYEDGWIDLGYGVTLNWDMED